MKKVFLAIALLIMPLLGFSACGDNSLSDNDIATIRGFSTRLDGAESDIAARPTLTRVEELIETAMAGVSASNLSSYTTDAELQTALDNFVANLTPAQITALKTALGISATTPAPTGQATVEIEETTPILLWAATPSGADFMGQAQFIVKITNDTASTKYVTYNLAIYCTGPVAGAGVIVRDATNVLTDNDTYPGWSKTYLPTLPTAAPTPQILCYFTTTTWGGVPVRAGESIEIIHLATMVTNVQSQWSCNLAGFASK